MMQRPRRENLKCHKYLIDLPYSRAVVPKMWGAPGRALVVLWGEGRLEVFVRGVYLFRTLCGGKIKYIFWKALCLFEMFYLLLSTGTLFKL
jgi:hypothetical protein